MWFFNVKTICFYAININLRDGEMVFFTLLAFLCVRLDLLAKKQTSKDGVFSFICRIFAYDRLHLSN